MNYELKEKIRMKQTKFELIRLKGIIYKKLNIQLVCDDGEFLHNYDDTIIIKHVRLINIRMYDNLYSYSRRNYHGSQNNNTEKDIIELLRNDYKIPLNP